MNTETKKRIEFLQKYLRKKYLKWHQMHPDNIVGFRIDKKIKNGKKERYYSIIFHVKKKKKEKNLSEKEIVPPYLLIKFPDGKIKKIKTDVEQTGRPRLHMGECRKPMNNGKVEVGTAGVVLKDNNDFFALTNYHVVAFERMQNDEFNFEGEDDNVFVNGQQATFVEGIFSDEIDAAFIQLSGADADPNLLGDGTQIGGFINGPLSPTLNERSVTVYSKNLKNGTPATINNISTIFFTGFQNLSLIELIQIRPCITKRGDSGGIVLINDDLVLGIIMGGDDKFTYAIPYFKINNFKPLIIA